MAPLLLCGVGTLFVLVVVRTHGVDVVPDSIGLIVYAVGLWRLVAASRLLLVAVALAVVAALAALPDFTPGLLPDGLDDGLDFTFTVAVGAAFAVGAVGIAVPARRAGDGLAWVFWLLATALLISVGVFITGWLINPSDHDRAVDLVRASQATTAVLLLTSVIALVLASGRGWASASGDGAGGQRARSKSAEPDPG